MTRIAFPLALAVLALVTPAARAAEGKQRNVVGVGGAVAVVFPSIGDPVFGFGPSLGYERVLSPVVSLAVSSALGFVPDDDDVSASGGLAVPIYFAARAPTGFYLAPGAGVGGVLGGYKLAFVGGISVGYQHVFPSGFVLGASAGPSVTIVEQFGDDVSFGVGAGVMVGYAF